PYAAFSVLSAAFYALSPAAPFTSQANYLYGDYAGVGDAFSPSPYPGDGDGSSSSPSPGVGDSSACRSPGDGEGSWPCWFSAPGEGEGVSPGCCCCFFFWGSFFACA